MDALVSAGAPRSQPSSLSGPSASAGRLTCAEKTAGTGGRGEPFAARGVVEGGANAGVLLHRDMLADHVELASGSRFISSKRKNSIHTC